MSHVAIVKGLSGVEFFLDRKGGLCVDERRARRFRSAEAARETAKAKVDAYPPVVQRYTTFRVEPAS